MFRQILQAAVCFVEIVEMGAGFADAGTGAETAGGAWAVVDPVGGFHGAPAGGRVEVAGEGCHGAEGV